MANENPTRKDLVDKLEALVAEYNSGTIDAAKFFDALKAFVAEMDEEQRRAGREGLTERVKSGSVKAYTISSAERSPALPTVPTSKEGGLPRYQLSFWSAVFAPIGTPPAVIKTLNAAIDSKRFAVPTFLGSA